MGREREGRETGGGKVRRHGWGGGGRRKEGRETGGRQMTLKGP